MLKIPGIKLESSGDHGCSQYKPAIYRRWSKFLLHIITSSISSTSSISEKVTLFVSTLARAVNAISENTPIGISDSSLSHLCGTKCIFSCSRAPDLFQPLTTLNVDGGTSGRQVNHVNWAIIRVIFRQSTLSIGLTTIHNRFH
jgi:hypothetical protein